MNRLPLILAFCFAVFTAVRGESDKRILLRFTSFGLQDASDEFVVAAGESLSEPFAIPDNGFSVPVPAPGAGPALALGKTGGTPFRSLATIKLPDSGKRFLVILLPGREDALRPIVIRADDPAFRAGQVMILNLAPETLAADLGGQKLRFVPGSRTIFRPQRKDDLANYQVRFFQAKEGKTKLFAASLWPYFDRKRAFVFLYTDSATGSPNYRAIDEFTDWLQN